jgi:acyl carrier protein
MTVPLSHAADTRDARVRQIISAIANVPPDAFGPDDELRTTLGLDSLSALRVAAGVEREFGVIIPDEKLHDLPTLRAMLEYLESHHTT